jgi:hypothetical protein
MNAIEAIEKLLWKKKQLKKLKNWLMEAEVDKPVDGKYWRELREIIKLQIEHMEVEIRKHEYKINEAVGEMKIDC